MSAAMRLDEDHGLLAPAIGGRPAGPGRTPSADNQPRITTARLTLRRPQMADAGAIAASLGNHAVARMLTRVPQPYHREDAEDWLAAIAADGRGWVFAITEGGRKPLGASASVAPGEGPVIGVVSIEWQEAGGRAGWHLGYWLDAGHWGKGIMTEAVNAVLARFFSAFLGEIVHSGVIADNPASLRVQQKLGFDVTGVGEAWCATRSEMVRLITTELTFGGYMPM